MEDIRLLLGSSVYHSTVKKSSFPPPQISPYSDGDMRFSLNPKFPTGKTTAVCVLGPIDIDPPDVYSSKDDKVVDDCLKGTFSGGPSY